MRIIYSVESFIGRLDLLCLDRLKKLRFRRVVGKLNLHLGILLEDCFYCRL